MICRHRWSHLPSGACPNSSGFEMFWGGLKCDRKELQNCRNVPNCIFACPLLPKQPCSLSLRGTTTPAHPQHHDPLYPTRCRVDQVPYFAGDVMDARLMVQPWGDAADAGSAGWMPSDGQRERKTALHFYRLKCPDASMRHRLASKNQPDPEKSRLSLTHRSRRAVAGCFITRVSVRDAQTEM